MSTIFQLASFILATLTTVSIVHAGALNEDLKALYECGSKTLEACENLRLHSAVEIREDIRTISASKVEKAKAYGELLAVDEAKLKTLRTYSKQNRIGRRYYEALVTHLDRLHNSHKWIHEGLTGVTFYDSYQKKVDVVRDLLAQPPSIERAYKLNKSLAPHTDDLFRLQQQIAMDMWIGPQWKGLTSQVFSYVQHPVSGAEITLLPMCGFMRAYQIPFDVSVIEKILGDETVSPVELICNETWWSNSISVDSVKRQVEVDYFISNSPGISFGVVNMGASRNAKIYPKPGEIGEAVLKAAGVH